MFEGFKKLSRSLFDGTAAFFARVFQDRPRRWLAGLIGLALFFAWGGYGDGVQIGEQFSHAFHGAKFSTEKLDIELWPFLEAIWALKFPLSKFIGALLCGTVISLAIVAVVLEARGSESEEDMLLMLLEKSGITQIYPSKQKVQITEQPYAIPLRESVATSKSVRIMMIAAYEYLGKGRDSLLLKLLQDHPDKNIQVILLDVTNGSDAVQSRIGKLRDRDDSYTDDVLRGHVEATKKALQRLKATPERKGTVELKFCKHQPIFRLVLLDDCLYVSAYMAGAHGHEAPIYRVGKCPDGKNETFYNAFESLYSHYLALAETCAL